MTTIFAFILGCIGPALIAVGLWMGGSLGGLACAIGGAWIGVLGMGLLLGDPKRKYTPSVTFSEWLRDQSSSTQRQVMGDHLFREWAKNGRHDIVMEDGSVYDEDGGVR